MKTKGKRIKNIKGLKMAVCHCHQVVERCECGRPAIPGVPSQLPEAVKQAVIPT